VVFEIRDGRAVEIPVTVGSRVGTYAEIRSGLKAGDKIIAAADKRLEAGSRVALKGP
jgi:multidrug efflux pump subunit AcrA (membrane-fusion protein)